jgi:hypothetical protein
VLVRDLIKRVEDLIPFEARSDGTAGYPRRSAILRFLKNEWNQLVRRYWWSFLNVDFTVNMSAVTPGNRAQVTLPVTLKSVFSVSLISPIARPLVEVPLKWINTVDPDRRSVSLPEFYAVVGGYPQTIEVYPGPSQEITIRVDGRALPDFPSSVDQDLPGPLDSVLIYRAAADLCRSLAAVNARSNPQLASLLMRQANEYDRLGKEAESDAIRMDAEQKPEAYDGREYDWLL